MRASICLKGFAWRSISPSFSFSFSFSISFALQSRMHFHHFYTTATTTTTSRAAIAASSQTRAAVVGNSGGGGGRERRKRKFQFLPPPPPPLSHLVGFFLSFFPEALLLFLCCPFFCAILSLSVCVFSRCRFGKPRIIIPFEQRVGDGKRTDSAKQTLSLPTSLSHSLQCSLFCYILSLSLL